MANDNTPFGLKPVKTDKTVIPVELFYVPSSYGTALFIGDPVVLTGTSNTNAIVSNGKQYNPGTLPEINKATAGAGNALVGSIVGFGYNPNDLSKAYNPASTEAIVQVACDPDQIFEIQEETAGTPLDTTSASLNANLVYAESGSTVTGLSGAELDTSTPASTQNFQLKILRLVDREDNAIGQHAKWLVKINQHQYSDNTAGVL